MDSLAQRRICCLSSDQSSIGSALAVSGEPDAVHKTVLNDDARGGLGAASCTTILLTFLPDVHRLSNGLPSTNAACNVSMAPLSNYGARAYTLAHDSQMLGRSR